MSRALLNLQATPSRALVRTPGQGSLIVTASAMERAVQFSRSARHTWLVRFLRVGLPVASVGLLSLYGLFLRQSIALPSGAKIDLGSVKISASGITMTDPHYDGFNDDGSKYTVTAKEATPGLSQAEPIKLASIEGKLTRADASVTILQAVHGSYDAAGSILELYDGITITSTQGLHGQLSRATVKAKEGQIASNEPVAFQAPMGTIEGNAMMLDQKTKKLGLSGGVHAVLKPEAKAAKVASGGPDALAAAGGGLGQLGGASGAPVDVTAGRLDVDDDAKLAVFSTAVRAVQDGSTLETAELAIEYSGQPADQGRIEATPAPPTPASTPPGANLLDGQAGNLKRMIAKSPLTLTRATDKITANSGEFNVASDLASLEGNVVITSSEGRQITGDHAHMNAKTSVSILSGHVAITVAPDRHAVADVAEIDTKNDTLLLKGTSVQITQGRNSLTGRRIFVNRKLGVSDVTTPAQDGLPAGRVTARLYTGDGTPAKPADKSAPKASAAQALDPSAGFNLRSDPAAPVDIDAESLHIADSQHQAVFKGQVHVVQGDMTIRTSELVATYTGNGGLASLDGASGAAKPEKKVSAGPKSKDADPTKGATEVTRIRAEKQVILTMGADRRVTGDWADFDMKAKIITIGGDVVLKGSDFGTLKCPNGFTINLNTNVNDCSDIAVANSSKSPPAAVLPGVAAAAVPPKSRQSLVIFPSAMKALEKNGAGAKAIAKPDAGKPSDVKLPPKGIADSWESSTAKAAKP